MRFFGLKSCDTCRKALTELRAAGLDPQVIDVRADGVLPEDLTAILAQFGDRAINRSSTTWRGLSDADRAQDPAKLLKDNPTLMKRPVIQNAGHWFIGWGPETRAALLGE